MSTDPAPVSQYLLQDDFSGDAPLDPKVWGINQYEPVNNPSYYGRTQIAQSLPIVSNGALQLTLSTYNPTGPGNAFVGSEIISNRTFDDNIAGMGIAFTAVAKIDGPVVPGMVGGIFAYDYNTSTGYDNELDFELLTNNAAAQNNPVQTNVYENQSLGTGNPEFVPDPTSLTTYQTYTMEWFPNAVLWFINGALVRESTVDVPQGPMAFHLNFWAPDTTWADAYSASLQPTSNSQDNTVYNFDVESVSVAAIENNTMCFLAGTQIATPAREVPVEHLVAGDQVLTSRGEARRVVWIGFGRVLATRGRRSAATPVIVRKGALADNVPHHDLRVTKAHSLYLDDVLIPVEFLVNHQSIAWDDRAQEVSIYHIELETHDVLLANGAPAESYRDDGNRWLFQNANTGWEQSPKPACAPVLTGGPIVDATWRRLLDRAGPRPGIPTTDDPDLHLLIGAERIDAASQHGPVRIFLLPNRPAGARIVSRAGAPAELGLARDPRVLGVAIQRVALRQETRFRVMEAADPALAEGFHAFEPDSGLRWTDGDAALPPALFEGFDGPMELVLHLGGTTQYPLFADAVLRAAA
jgi:hypothetical protein